MVVQLSSVRGMYFLYCQNVKRRLTLAGSIINGIMEKVPWTGLVALWRMLCTMMVSQERLSLMMQSNLPSMPIKLSRQLQIKTAPKIHGEMKESFLSLLLPRLWWWSFSCSVLRSPSLLECKHMIQEVIDENFCISCRNRYSKTDTSDWLKCAVCKQWFHENCF